MTNKKGGYQIIDVIALTYATALACVECGKPLLVINDEDNTPYFADSIKVDSDNDDAVVISKGGRTITIEDDGTITQSGEIKKEIYLKAVTFTDSYNDIILRGTYLSTNNNEMTEYDADTFNDFAVAELGFSDEEEEYEYEFILFGPTGSPDYPGMQTLSKIVWSASGGTSTIKAYQYNDSGDTWVELQNAVLSCLYLIINKL